MCCGGWRRTAPRRGRALVPSAPVRPRAGRDDGDDRDRKVVLRHLEPVLDRDVVGAAACSAASSSDRPRTRPRRARARERSRLVALAPLRVLALEQGARLLPLDAGASVFTTASVASCTSCSPPTAAAKSCMRTEVRRRLDVAGEPGEDHVPPPAPERRALRRRARRRARPPARACSKPILERPAHARRMWISTCAPADSVSSSSASSSSSAERSSLRARRAGRRSARNEPRSASARRPVAIDLARVHSPAA